MGRHKLDEEHVNHERWLVSYADFITLLFAFFVVMFASSNADRQKLKQVSENIAGALKEGRLNAMAKSPASGTGHQEGASQGLANLKPDIPMNLKAAELTPSLRLLMEALKDDIDKGKLQVMMEPRGLVISLKEAAFFPPGGDTLAAESLPIIEKLAEVIRTIPNPVRLEGHTDSIPIRNEKFRSNWELSSARSIAMLRVLNERYGIAINRMAAVAYAETVAAGSNNSEEGRKLNRRVDIAILNEDASRKEAHGEPHAER